MSDTRTSTSTSASTSTGTSTSHTSLATASPPPALPGLGVLILGTSGTSISPFFIGTRGEAHPSSRIAVKDISDEVRFKPAMRQAHEFKAELKQNICDCKLPQP